METFASKDAECFRKSHLDVIDTALEKSVAAPIKFKVLPEHRELNKRTALRIKIIKGLQEGGGISEVKCSDNDGVLKSYEA